METLRDVGRKEKELLERQKLSRAITFQQTTMVKLGKPKVYEALSLGPNNSTKLFGSCPFTYKKLGVGTCHVTLYLWLAK